MAGAFLQSDLSAVFNTADFAIVANVMDDTATPVKIGEVTGIFENSTQEIAQSEDRSAMIRQAIFMCPTSAAVNVGTVLQIDGALYVVRYPEHDGTGVTTWYLEKWRLEGNKVVMLSHWQLRPMVSRSKSRANGR